MGGKQTRVQSRGSDWKVPSRGQQGSTESLRARRHHAVQATPGRTSRCAPNTYTKAHDTQVPGHKQTRLRPVPYVSQDAEGPMSHRNS